MGLIFITHDGARCVADKKGAWFYHLRTTTKEALMGNAISVCFSKYATFSGRASRSEYWFFYLFYVIVYIAGMIVEGVVGITGISYIFILPILLPTISAAVRRMHDSGRSGWFILVPFYNLVLACTPSNPGSNKYGDL